jgi:hypothetical protein
MPVHSLVRRRWEQLVRVIWIAWSPRFVVCRLECAAPSAEQHTVLLPCEPSRLLPSPPPPRLHHRRPAPDPFFDAATSTQSYPFHLIDAQVYGAVFARHALGPGSAVAQGLGVDGADTALRCDLGEMLNEVLGRQARKAELQVGHTLLGFCLTD